MFRSIVTLVLLLYTASLILFGGQFVFALDNSNIIPDTYPHISALENAILGQSFPGQSLTERLERMEKKAFGKASPNPDLSERTDALDDYTDKQLHKKLLQANYDTATGSDDQSSSNQTDYPRVTALEKTILGQTFPGQPLADRLSRMEKKVFGSESINPDLSARTDALDDYSDKQLPNKLFQTNIDAETTDSANNQSFQNQADYPHVTALEHLILGQTYAGQPLADRLSRMEIMAFGSAFTNLDLSARTDALETYAEKKLHKKAVSGNETDTEADTTQHSGLMSKVEKAFLGMAGANGPGLAMGSGMGGMGFPGMGFGGMNNGFGGVNNGMGGGGMRRRQAAQQQQPEPPAPTHPEDPAVYLANPPDSSAKLIVKVGWCEVKIFGHTFPNMHLPERLGQLNRELKLEPDKSDIQLMDDIGLMIKAVQARKQSAPINRP